MEKTTVSITTSTRNSNLVDRLRKEDWCIVRQNPGNPQEARVVFFSDRLGTWRCFERNNGLQLQTVTSVDRFLSTVVLDFDSMFLWA